MEESTKILVTAPSRPTVSMGQACLVHIFPTGPVLGSPYPLRDTAVLLGSGEDCQIHIADNSAVGRHAVIAWIDA